MLHLSSSVNSFGFPHPENGLCVVHPANPCDPTPKDEVQPLSQLDVGGSSLEAADIWMYALMAKPMTMDAPTHPTNDSCVSTRLCTLWSRILGCSFTLGKMKQFDRIKYS